MTDDFLTTRFTCTAPEGSACRLICTNEDCEPETWTTDGSHEHELRDSGKCSAKEWFEAVDWTECHESFGHESVLYDGPVNAFWDGEDFQWQIDRTGPDAQVTQLTQDLAVANAKIEEARIALLDIQRSPGCAPPMDRMLAILGQHTKENNNVEQ